MSNKDFDLEERGIERRLFGIMAKSDFEESDSLYDIVSAWYCPIVLQGASKPEYGGKEEA